MTKLRFVATFFGALAGTALAEWKPAHADVGVVSSALLDQPFGEAYEPLRQAAWRGDDRAAQRLFRDVSRCNAFYFRSSTRPDDDAEQRYCEGYFPRSLELANYEATLLAARHGHAVAIACFVSWFRIDPYRYALSVWLPEAPSYLFARSAEATFTQNMQRELVQTFGAPSPYVCRDCGCGD